MTSPFQSIAILGPGLIGGSIAYAIQEALPQCDLRLWARRQASVDLAKELQLAQVASTDLAEVVRGAELIILATPISAFMHLSEAILPYLSPEAIVTDIGSVKDYVHRTTGAFLAEKGHCFIGSHPMAGTEKQGLENAFASLMNGATIAMCNEQDAPAEKVAALEAFWLSIGSLPYLMKSKDHDRTVARISHLPHVLAALCARCAQDEQVDKKDLQRLAASGFRDTTRVSTGSPSMWADILWENDVAVREALQHSIEDLQHLIDLLEGQDKPATEQWLLDAKLTREFIYRK